MSFFSSSLKLVNLEKTNISVTLPHVKGHKYNLGPRFSGYRQPGTEFVLLYDHPRESGHPHCQIRCGEDGTFWITWLAYKSISPLSDGEVEIDEGMLIENGDVLKMGGQSFEAWVARGGDGDGVDDDKVEDKDIVGRMGKLDLVPKKKNHTWTWNPLDNDLILSNVLSFLSGKDLINSRLVSNFWNSKAIPPFLKSTQIVFDFTCAVNDWKNPNTWLKFWNYINSSVSNFHHPNLRIKLPASKLIPIRLRAKLVTDIEWFFGPEMNLDYLSILKLEVDGYSRGDFEHVYSILRKVGSNLKELSLHVKLGYELYNVPILPKDIKFENLEKFTLNVPMIPGCQDYTGFANSWSLATNMKITCLHLKSDQSGHKIDLAFLSAGIFPNLEEVRIRDASIQVLNLLLVLYKPLRTLDLGKLNTSEEGAQLCQKLIQKNSRSLENLRMVLPYKDEKKEEAIPFFNLCPMPNLKNLDIRFDHFPGSCVIFKSAFRLRMSIHGSVDYDQDFPNIESLSLVPHRLWGDWDFEEREQLPWEDQISSLNGLESFWNLFGRHHFSVFFPSSSPPKVFKSLCHLDFPVLFREKCHPDGKGIAQMFPNVCGQIWSKVRRYK